jgi:hypothetical protein
LASRERGAAATSAPKVTDGFGAPVLRDQGSDRLAGTTMLTLPPGPLRQRTMGHCQAPLTEARLVGDTSCINRAIRKGRRCMTDMDRLGNRVGKVFVDRINAHLLAVRLCVYLEKVGQRIPNDLLEHGIQASACEKIAALKRSSSFLLKRPLRLSPSSRRSSRNIATVTSNSSTESYALARKSLSRLCMSVQVLLAINWGIHS